MSWWTYSSPSASLPDPPTRDQMLRGRITAQGLTIQTTQFGAMPWWPGCWAWLNAQSRQEAAGQLLAHGDTICAIAYPDGRALYDETGQFYAADKFPPLAITMEQLAELVAEAIGFGFAGCWIFLGGDTDFEESDAQVKELGPTFKGYAGGDLNQYALVLPGWDGVWHFPGGVYTREQIRQFSLDARAAGVIYVGCEHGTGYPLAGDGAGADYLPGGVMSAYDLILGEFDDGRFDDSAWQILARYLGPDYIRPPQQPHDDDPPPVPFYLKTPNEFGLPYVYCVWEFAMYGAVRGTPNSTIAGWRQQFHALGASHVA